MDPRQAAELELQCALKWNMQSPKQEAFSASKKRIRIAFGGNRCLPLSAPILTSDGSWKALGELREGEVIKCGCGKDTIIKGTSRAGKKEVFKLSFSDGGYVIASREHHFPTLYRHQSDEGVVKKRTVEQIINRKKVCVSKRTKFLSSVIDYPEQKFIISPYLMGILLGDGSISSNSIGITNNDQLVIRRVRKEVERLGLTLKKGGGYYYGISQIVKKSNGNPIKNEIERLGLNEVCENKFIPNHYKYSSREQRLELLAGLIDSDGTRDDFISKSEKLANDFIEVLRSLGGKGKVTPCKKSCVYKGERKWGDYFRIYYAINLKIPVILERKWRETKRKPNYLYRIFRDYESLEEEECGDIEVSCDCHTYISYDWIITGNTGKSHVTMQEVAMAIFGSHKFRTDFKAPIEVWVCCPSYDVQRDTTQKKLEELIPAHRIKHISYVKSNTWGTVEIDNGSQIVFKSYDSGREKFQGAGKRLIAFDEEPPKDIWEECSVRVEAGVPLDIVMAMTPLNGMTFVYTDLYLNTENPDLYITTFGWDDNPWLTEEQKQQMARGLTEEGLMVRREGKFVQRTGLVCNWWDRGIHLDSYMIRQSSWNIYRIIDFGWSSSKTCVLWIGVDSYDRVYVFDGIYENQLDDDELAKIIKEREKSFRVVKSWADNAPDRIEGLRKRGVTCEPIKKAGGEDGWDTSRAEAMARIGKKDPITGKSKLAISSTLTHYNADKGISTNWFVEEVESLRWNLKRVAAGIKTETAKWDKDSSPKDSHFDAIDCFSYFAIMFSKKNAKFRKEMETPDDWEERFDKKKTLKKRKVLNPLTGY